jgi:glycosyltransferase involved in cell wall biosynthesis
MAKQETNVKNLKPMVIDCQVFQASSWHRGMGKYSKELIEALVKNKKMQGQFTTYYLFNSSIDLNDEAVAFVKRIDPGAELLYVDLDVPKVAVTERSVLPVIEHNRQVLDVELSQKFGDQEYSFMILALYLDEVCPVFPSTATDKLLVYYDAIPYLYHERYDKFIGFFDNFYLPFTRVVYEATKLLAISRTVANGLGLMFGMPEETIFAIDGASISRSQEKPTRPKKLPIDPDHYVFMPTGQELRKNNTRAVRAFEQFRQKHDSATKLVITSHFTLDVQAELQAISPNIVFSGNVSEGEMLWLYQNCRLVLFPSEYEGLGLPILEAAEQYKPIVCSDISVFREISKTAFSYFDPLNIDSIAEVLAEVYDSPPAVAVLKEAYKDVLATYTWSRTAELTAEAAITPMLQVPVDKKRIAILGPDPSGFSAIGKVIVESHAWYSQFFDITYYFDRGPNHKTMRPNLLKDVAPQYDASTFNAEEAKKYDYVIYHIGNSEYHLNILHAALAVPGYAILHDTFLNGAYSGMLSQSFMSQQRVELEEKLDELQPDLAKDGESYSLNLTSVINGQKAVLTHSQYAKRAVTKKLLNDSVKVVQVNLPVDVPVYPDIIRGAKEKITVSFAGIIAKVKGVDTIKELVASHLFADCTVNIFGYSSVEPELIASLEALSNVNLVKSPSDHDFQSLMAQTDILVNVRLEYRGETSLTTLEAMRYGVVAMVRDFGWYHELPENTVVRVDEPASTLRELRELLDHPSKIEAIKKDSMDYMREHFTRRQYAQAMYDLMD